MRGASRKRRTECLLAGNSQLWRNDIALVSLELSSASDKGEERYFCVGSSRDADSPFQEQGIVLGNPRPCRTQRIGYSSENNSKGKSQANFVKPNFGSPDCECQTWDAQVKFGMSQRPSPIKRRLLPFLLLAIINCRSVEDSAMNFPIVTSQI